METQENLRNEWKGTARKAGWRRGQMGAEAMRGGAENSVGAREGGYASLGGGQNDP